MVTENSKVANVDSQTMTDTKWGLKRIELSVIPELRQLKLNNIIPQELSSIPELQQLNIKMSTPAKS